MGQLQNQQLPGALRSKGLLIGSSNKAGDPSILLVWQAWGDSHHTEKLGSGRVQGDDQVFIDFHRSGDRSLFTGLRIAA